MYVLKLDGDGRIVISKGRAQIVEDLEAKAQLLRERVYLERGDDFFRRNRGVPWSDLKAVRASPSTVAVEVGREVEKDPLTVSASFEPIGDGYRPRSIQAGEPFRVYALTGAVTVTGEKTAAEIAVEVSLG